MEEQNFEFLRTLTALYELYMSDPVVRKKVKNKLSTTQQTTPTPPVSAPTKTPETKKEEVDIQGFFDQSWK